MQNNSKPKTENIIIERIKQRRKDLNLSYQELSDRTGLSKSTLQRYETGDIMNIPLSKVDVLAKGLQTTPAYLMGWEENKNANTDINAADRSAGTEQSEDMLKLEKILSELCIEDLKTLAEHAEYLASRHKKQNP